MMLRGWVTLGLTKGERERGRGEVVVDGDKSVSEKEEKTHAVYQSQYPLGSVWHPKRKWPIRSSLLRSREL